MAKEKGAHKLLTNCPSCILFLEQGLELMRESGEPMECGIFDFYKVFSRAFGEGEDGAEGSSNGRWGMSPRPFHVAKEQGANKLLTQLPVLYLILRAGAGVEAGGGRAYGVRDF